jgi:glucose/arabinose dehydrogenase
MRRGSVIAAIAWISLAAWAPATEAASLQPIGQFPGAIYVTSDPGNPDWLFVAGRSGKVFQLKGGILSTVADLESQVSCCKGEQGLLSVAVAPDFDSSGRLFVAYTGKEEPGGEIHVDELALDRSGVLVGQRELLRIPHPEEAVHYGGQLQFGPEGDLYISTGDGGPANDGSHNAQNLERLLGKILRIDPNPGAVLPYKVPADNPFVGQGNARPEIWSYGLRNPFRFSFDRLTGAITIGDVGQDAREEIDYAPGPAAGRGANYGWNCREGLIAGPETDPECPTATGLVNPVFDYPHDPGCAIIGGFVVRDASLGDLYGRYVYADYCSGEVRSLDLANPAAGDRSEGLRLDFPVSFGEDSCGRVYAVSSTNTVYRLVGAAPAACPQLRRRPFLGIRPRGRAIERNRRATIVVFVSPCVREAALSVTVELWRNGRRWQRKHLNRVCSAAFRPRIARRTRFQARLPENATYLAAESRSLTIRSKRRHRAERHRHRRLGGLSQ